MATVTINIEGQLIIQTAAQWALDATIYGAKHLLITSDVLYAGTNQRKFKIPDGVLAWSALDYFPVGGSVSVAFADITGDPLDNAALSALFDDVDQAVDTISEDLQGHIDDLANPHGVTKTQVGLSNVQNLDQTDPSNITQSASYRFTTDAEKAAWNAIIGGSVFQTVWNATTNSPALASSTGTKGHYYIVATAGATNLDGITDWKVGDWAIYDGTVWRKVDNTDAVSSVNGLTGAVVLDTSNVSDTSNKRYVTDAEKIVIGNTSGINSGNETAATIGTIVNAATNYATPLDADKIGIWDTVNSLFKAVTWANIKATLKTYFDSLYKSQLLDDLHALGHSSFSPSDGQVVYFNSKIASAPQATNIVRDAFKRSGTIYAATIYTSTTLILGSSETTTTAVRINDTTDHTLSASTLFTARANVVEVTGLNIAFSANDDWAIKQTFPTFATNPTSVVTQVILHVRYSS